MVIELETKAECDDRSPLGERIVGIDGVDHVPEESESLLGTESQLPHRSPELLERPTVGEKDPEQRHRIEF